MAAQVFAAFIDPKESARGAARAFELIGAFDRILKENADILGRVIHAWEIATLRGEGRIGAILSIENGDALEGDLDNLERLYARGVRMMILTWNAINAYADGVQEEVHGGLTLLGRDLIAHMQALGMVVDVSHLSVKSFWDVFNAMHGPVVASHSSAASLNPHPRNLTDDQLKAIAQRGGVVGVNFYPLFLGQPTLERLLDHLDHLVETMGDQHVGLGSDFDGFPGQVVGLEDVSKLPNLTAGLRRRGYAREAILKLLGGNVLRVFKRIWGD
jgi:membrane dipeptidase